MTTAGKILIGVGVIAIGVTGFFIYKWNTPPTFTVTAFDAATGVYSFTFGDVTAQTSAVGDYQAGYGWGLQVSGNKIVVVKNDVIYNTVTLSGIGVVNI